MLVQDKKVRNEKTKIYFSHNVHYARAKDIKEEFRFSLTGNLGKYLGIPLTIK